MKNIAIFGAGGFGREVYQLIQKLNKAKKQWNFLGFFDDNTSVNFGQSKIPLNHLGTIKELNEYPDPLEVVIALGLPDAIHKVTSRISNKNISYPNIIAPDSIIYDDDLTIGHGNIITSGCIFTDNITIGNFNIFNLKVSVGHDVKIGDCNVFNPNSAISGNVTIGDKNFFGLNSSIVQDKKVGSNNKVGAATLIIKNINDNEFYFGVPGYKSTL
jgi:sugar O-acyltransferase (sialic acid O-acetyltransferase NeuD family)